MPPTLRVHLELDPALDSIGGIVRHPPTGEPTPFAGGLDAIRRPAAEAR